MVGYLEYGMALGYFDELMRKLTDDELAAVSDFVAENPAFTVFTNLSRRTEQRRSALTELPNSTGSRRESVSTSGSPRRDKYDRRGLSWVIALARVEYAAILATFTTTPNPFVAVRPTPYELPAYKELLLDGARMHYWSLQKDPALKKVTRSSPNNPVVLSYSRRLGLARKLLTAVAKAGMGELTPYQYRELASWKRDLDQLHAGLLATIQSYLAMEQERTATSSTTKEKREFVRACSAQLAGEAAELKAGSARVYQLKPK